MTSLQMTKATYEARYNEQANAKNARARFGQLPGRGNSKEFWNAVQERMHEEVKAEWEREQQAEQRRNANRQQQAQQRRNANRQAQAQQPSFSQIFSAALNRGYCHQEAETLATKALEMLKSNPAKAYKLFLNRLNLNIA